MTDVEKQATPVASETGISREATTSPTRTPPPERTLSPASSTGGVRNATKRMLGFGSSPRVGLERVNTTVVPPSSLSNTLDDDDDDDDNNNKNNANLTGTTVSRKSSSERLFRYSTRAFLRVERPVPVADVLQGARFVILMRVTYRFLEFWFQSMMLFLAMCWIFPVLFSVVVVVVRAFGKRYVGQVPVPTVLEVWLNVYTWPQKLWEYGFAKYMLKQKYRRATWLWWWVYQYIATGHDFEHNIVEAWGEREDGTRLLIHVFTEDEHMQVPIIVPEPPTDDAVLSQLKMFYRVLKLNRGLAELLIPRELSRIDTVTVEEGSNLLGERTKTLSLGRRSDRVRLFREPSRASKDNTMANELDMLGRDKGLEFIRVLNRGAMAHIILTPAIGSLVFIIVWIVVFLGRQTVEDPLVKQAVVTTAFTVGAYVVTAGALVIALVAYLDDKQAENYPADSRRMEPGLHRRMSMA